MTPTQKELEQNVDWLKSHYYSLLKRVEDIEHQRLTVAVSPSQPNFGAAIRETTGEAL